MFKSPKFTTKRGRLTAYAFNCGYVEYRLLEDNSSITLWKEHNVYHVRMHHKYHGRIFWDSFPTLTEARKRYHEAIPH